MSLTIDNQATAWNAMQSRYWHAWQMLQTSFAVVQNADAATPIGFDIDYAWENLILRLWIFRTVSKTSTAFANFSAIASHNIEQFDKTFESGGVNSLWAIRSYIEHFDEYAVGKGHGPAEYKHETDPWRRVTNEIFEFGPYTLKLVPCKEAANALWKSSNALSLQFKGWYLQQPN